MSEQLLNQGIGEYGIQGIVNFENVEQLWHNTGLRLRADIDCIKNVQVKFDLGNVSKYTNSALLAYLVQVQILLRSYGKILCLTNLPQYVADLARACSLLELLQPNETAKL